MKCEEEVAGKDERGSVDGVEVCDKEAGGCGRDDWRDMVGDSGKTEG